MMPHQIYCDWLEDKGIDARLLRVEEEVGVTVHNDWSKHHVEIGANGDGGWRFSGDGYGIGYLQWGCGYGNINGDSIFRVFPPANGSSFEEYTHDPISDWS